MSGLIARVRPRRIKAAHRRRRQAASGQSVQRYYDPLIGRFLSVDPVTANSNTGTNFNRYWYANNNPYKFTDPDGRYVCSGSKADCAAVRSALREVRSAMNSSLKGGEGRAALKSVLNFYGKEGAKNGVTVSFGATNGAASTQNSGRQVSIKVDMGVHAKYAGGRDTSYFRAYVGASLMHEGQHGLDSRTHAEPTSRAQAKAGELRAAGTEAYAWEALQTNSPWKTWTNEGGRSQSAIDNQAEKSTEAWCASGGNCR